MEIVRFAVVGFLRNSNIMAEHEITAICSKCSTLLTLTEDSLLRCGKCCIEYGPKSNVYDEQFPEHSPLLEQQRRKEDGNPIESPQGPKNPIAQAQPSESQNDTNRLLRQIEANTAKTAFWTKVVGVPVLIGIITGALVSMAKCT